MRLCRSYFVGPIVGLIAIAVFGLSTACGRAAPPETPAPPWPPTALSPAATAASAAVAELPQAASSPEPIPVRFSAADGRELDGAFYPPAEASAAVVVLMHWIRGDQSDWEAVAGWLQNRLPPGEPSSGGSPWLDASWFPPLGSDRAYAVFTFTFRDCQGGCKGFEPEGWLGDARAALQVAAGQPGVDPMRLVAIGASIGGDGAIDACAWLSTKTTGSRCIGAISLSPGGYLGVPYADAVRGLTTALDDTDALPPAGAALCLASEGDTDSAEACASAQGPHYRAIAYPGRAHGMELIEPSLAPNVLSAIADFLASVTYR